MNEKSIESEFWKKPGKKASKKKRERDKEKQRNRETFALRKEHEKVAKTHEKRVYELRA